jgi:Zn-dependent alcohol dehydrogenase
MIIGVDIKEKKLEVARGFGVTHTINSARENVVRRIQELTEGRGVDYAYVDTSCRIGKYEIVKGIVTRLRQADAH